jgi:four helix bundle protein
MQTYKDLIVWQKSIELTVEIYRLTALFPPEEKFGITSQMRRCSVSIASNIAEGFGRNNRKENAHFVNIAYASATELETQIIISKELHFIDNNEWIKAEKLLEKVLKLSYNYRKYLSSN